MPVLVYLLTNTVTNKTGDAADDSCLIDRRWRNESIIVQIGHGVGDNFNIHISACSGDFIVSNR